MINLYKRTVFLLGLFAAMMLAGSAASAVPNQLDILSFDAPAGDVNGIDDFILADGINGQITAASGGNIGVIAVDTMGNPDSTASGTVIVDLRGQHTNEFISLSGLMTNGAAIITVPTSLTTADRYWIQATLSGFSLGSADGAGDTDTLTVVGGSITGLTLHSDKQAISNRNIDGAGATVRVFVVDQHGNYTSNDGNKTVTLTDAGGFFNTTDQFFPAHQSWVDVEIGGNGIPLDTAVNVPGELTLSAAFATQGTFAVQGNLTGDSLGLTVYSEHLVATYTNGFGGSPRAASNTIFPAFNVVTSAGTIVPSATIEHQVRHTGATIHRTIETNTGAFVSNNLARIALTRETGEISAPGDERYRISRNGLGDAVVNGDALGDIIAGQAVSVVYYDANESLTNVIPIIEQGGQNQAQILASRLIPIDEFGNQLSIVDDMGNRLSIETILSAGGATLSLNPATGLVARGEGAATLIGGPNQDSITVSFGNDLPNVVLQAVQQLGGEPLLGNGMTTPVTTAITQTTMNCTTPPGCELVSAGLGNAIFRGGVSINNGPRAATIGVIDAPAKQSDSFSIRGSIDIPPEHEGMPGRIQVFVVYADPAGNTFFFQILGPIHQGGSVHPWDTNILTAGAFRLTNAFTDVESVDIFSGSLAGLPGTLLFAIGYQVGETFDTATQGYFHGAQFIQLVIE
ncbi:MAG: hypothetical protein AAF512_05235 [Pseudomonadota bacterium]